MIEANKTSRRSRKNRCMLLTTILSAFVAASAFGAPPSVGVASEAPGVADGYVDDKSCAICHSDFYRPYQEVGMARSFYRPDPASSIEDFGTEYYHEPSRRYYRMIWRGDELFFERYQLTDQGSRINLVEQRVDWILGSGNRSRTYLFRTPSGMVFQLPLAWYSQLGAWRMAPGFDDREHLGMLRRVRRECMYCHNAYPDMPAGSDLPGRPQVFPEILPEGIGCQRCHGPAQKHLDQASSKLDPELMRASIFNPGRLPAERRTEVCYGCHFQPTVAMPRARVFDRGTFSHRPEESLGDYLVLTDVEEEGHARGDRFEINHHAYRLEQSRCFIESARDDEAGGLDCLTCHDPHRKPAPEEKAAHYRRACLSCHEIDVCDVAAMSADANGGDCVACHMPQHRPSDVVHVTMTDHRIVRRGDADWTAPREEDDPILVDIEVLPRPGAPTGELAEIYRAATTLRALSYPEAVDYLANLLPRVRPDAVEPYLDFAKGSLRLQRWDDADAALDHVLTKDPKNPQALQWKAIAARRGGRLDEAVAGLRRVVESDPSEIDAAYNLGVLLEVQQRPVEAMRLYEELLKLHPYHAPTWQRLGDVQVRLDRPDEAIHSYEQALAAEPLLSAGYVSLSRALAERGRVDEARTWLRHGARVAADPEAVLRAAADLDLPETRAGD